MPIFATNKHRVTTGRNRTSVSLREAGGMGTVAEEAGGIGTVDGGTLNEEAGGII